MENKFNRFLSLLLAVIMVVGMIPGNFAFAAENDDVPNVTVVEPENENPEGIHAENVTEPITGTITENVTWNDGDEIGGVIINGNVTITVKGTVTVSGTIRLSPDAISSVTFNGENNAKLIRGSEFTGQMFYAEGVSGNFQNLTFNDITLDGGAVWTGDVDKTLNRGKTNEGVKATGSVLYLVYANADLNDSVLQNHDDSTGEKANAVFLRYYSTIDFNNSVVRNNNSVSSYYRGGVITVRQGGIVKTNNTEVYGNFGTQGGFFGTSSTGSYGGIVEVYNSKFHNNYAASGALFDMQCNSNKGYLLIDGCEFYENASGRGLIYEYAYSRPVTIKDSYFHGNECAVWDCHADPVLNLSGKIVIEEDPDYTGYLFETPLVLGAPLADGSSIPLSAASLAKLGSTIITGTTGYNVTEADLAKLTLPEGYSLYLADTNGDGIGDVVSSNNTTQTAITLTLKDMVDASASEEAIVYSGLKCLPINPFAHEGLIFAGWIDASGQTVAKQNFAEAMTLTATWKLVTPIAKLSREGATLKVVVANASDDVVYSYQWYMDNVAIEGATAATYTMTDVNSHNYKCEVTASKEGFEPVTSNASGNSSAPAAAQVGETKYGSLKEAITAANAIEGGATVTLLKDITLGEKLTISGNVTISGAYTITRADTYTGTLFTVNSGATLTFKDVTVDGGNNWTFLKDDYEAQVRSGERVNNSNVNYAVYEEGAPVATATVVSVNGNVILDGATFQNHVGHSVFTVASGATLTMTNAKVGHNTRKGSSIVADIASGATWIINAGTEITNNHNHGGNGTLSYMKGTTIMNGGKICSNSGVDNNGSVFMIYGGAAKFVMNDGTICHNWALYGTNNGWNCTFYVYGNGAKFEMNGGVIEENVSTVLPGVANNGSSGTIQVNGGEIRNNTSAKNYVGTELYGYCPITIGEGVTITGGVQAFNNLTNNGTIEGRLNVGGTSTISGTGIVTGDVKVSGTVTITSGTYLGKIIVTGNLAITGGTFTQDVSEWLDPNAGLVYDEATGTFGVVTKNLYKLHLTDPTTGEPATIPYLEGNDLASLVATGKLFYANYYKMELEVLYDVKINEPVVIDYPMTINLNGKTITGVNDIYPVIRVQGEAKVTVTGNGTIKNDDYVFVLGASDGSSAGYLNIENGTFVGETTVASVTKGTLTITGGTFTSDVSDYCADGYICEAKDGIYKVVPNATKVIVTVDNATKVAGNTNPEFSYTTDVELDFDLNITYTVDGTTINATVAAVDGYEFEVVPGTLTTQTALVCVNSGSSNMYFVDLNEALQYAYSRSTTSVNVKILGNLTVTEPIVINDADAKKNSIEMTSSNLSKNCTITVTGSAFIKMEAGTLYVKSLNIEAENDAFYVTGGTVELRSYGSTQITNVTSKNGNCVYIRGGKVNVYGARLTSLGEYPAIQGNGNYAGNVNIGIWNYSTNKATSTISAPNADMAIYWPQNGTLSITAGTITGKTALYVKSGRVNISGGKLVATGEKADFAHNSNGANATGDAVVIEACKDAAYETPVVVISGGTFTSANAEAVMFYGCDTAADEAAIMELTGGLYSSMPNVKWCVAGKAPVLNDNNMWEISDYIVTVDNIYYNNWTKAKAAIKGDSKIVLYADITNSGSFSVGAIWKTVTLDLNGHKFTTDTIGQSNHQTLHITDSAEGGSVKVNNFTALYTNGYLNVDSDVNFNSKIQFGYHSAETPSTGCLLIDGVKLIGRGHYQSEDGIFGITGGYVTLTNGVKNITFTSGNFTMNKDYVGDVTDITINANVNVDLNGNKLAAKNIVAFGNLIDSADGVGAVVASGEYYYTNHTNNDYLPLKDGDCYRLFKTEVKTRGVKIVDENTLKYGYTIYFNNADAYKLLGEMAADNKFSVVTTWTGETVGFTRTFKDATVEKFAQKAYEQKSTFGTVSATITLTVSGVSGFVAGEEIYTVPTISALIGVAVSGENHTYTIK